MSANGSPRRVRVLGVEIDRVGLEQAVAIALAWLQGGADAGDAAAGDAPRGGARIVVTPNAEMVYAAGFDRELAGALARADLAVPDGAGVVWAARRVGKPVPERVPGVELGERLVAECARLGLGVFLLGGRPGVAEAAAAALRRRHPGLRVAGTHHGYFAGEDEVAIMEAISAARPALLLVGLGSPRQEKWLDHRRAELACRVAIGVGGSLDIWAGTARRAPLLWRRLHAEWLFRLYREPWRWRRMLALPRFAWAVLWNGERPMHRA